MAAAVALHNVPEGMVIGAAFASGTTGEGASGVTLAAVIALHNIPEGMAVAGPLRSGNLTRRLAVAAAAVTGAPTVAGAALGYRLGSLGPIGLAVTLGFASGAMLYVVFGELLPEALRSVAVPGPSSGGSDRSGDRTGNGIWIIKARRTLCGGLFTACSAQTRMRGAGKGETGELIILPKRWRASCRTR